MDEYVQGARIDQVNRVISLLKDDMGLTMGEGMTLLVCTMWHLCRVNDIGVEDGVSQISEAFRSIEVVDRQQH
jgi:hypothetical protein